MFRVFQAIRSRVRRRRRAADDYEAYLDARVKDATSMLVAGAIGFVLLAPVVPVLWVLGRWRRNRERGKQ